MKSRITRLLGTVLAGVAMVAIPIKHSKALDYWDDLTILEDVVEGEQVVGQVRLPDWERIALEDFPAVNRGGSISSEFNTYVGYDLSREWLAGDSLVDILKLGDVEEAFAVHNFSIREIAELTGLDTNSIALSSFELVKGQSLEELVESIPGLGQKRVGQIEPIAKLIKNKLGYGFDDTKLESLVEFNSLTGKLTLGEIDLSEYSIDAIPGLKDILLGKFEGWENTLIRGIPGLAQVPLSQMPNPLSNRGMPVMRIDAIWSDAESNRNRTVSGSYEDGFDVPCTEGSRCPYIELDDLEQSGSSWRLPTEGKQWIEGRDPVKGNICPDAPWGVNGGHGVLGVVNCGKEPTGRHPFGKAFKLAIWGTDETTDSVDTAVFFPACAKTLFADLGCTPYFIGPIPFFSFQRDDWIFLGI